MKRMITLTIALVIAIMSGLALAGTTPEDSFPADFPKLKDQGGSGAGGYLTGFGGDLAPEMKKAGNRAALKHVPVILLHGNGGYAEHSKWGMQKMKEFLTAAGYNDSEIWAVSYLGATNSTADMTDPHRNNIEDVRSFIDAVIEYLGVEKVVLIGHSLGAGMARSYLLGLDRSGAFKPSLTRFDKVAGLITLAGANYGLGKNQSEFITGSNFEVNAHKVTGTNVWDDTPYGSKTTRPTNEAANIPLPANRNYNNGKFGFCGTSVDVEDNDPRRIYYAGITATGDFVDTNMRYSSYLQGADFNKAWNVGVYWTGHENVIKTQEVFDGAVLPTLKLISPIVRDGEKPVTTISPNGGEFTESQTVTISATNNPTKIEYQMGNGGWKDYGDPFSITESCAISARARNNRGPGEVVSVSFTKNGGEGPGGMTSASDTASGHYNAKRLDVNGYMLMGFKYGHINKFNLYKVGEKWTDEKPQ